jgi:flagellar protein FliS
MNHTNNASGGAGLYNQVAVHTGVGAASPHRLIQMLLNTGLEKIAAAKGCIERGDIGNRGRHVSHAISIVEGLRASLDQEKGGDIAKNLFDLYTYMERRLFEANLAGDSEALNEVADLMIQIKSAWDAIPDGLPQDTTTDVAEREAG